MPHSRSPEGTAAQKRRDLRRRRYMRSALPILRTQRDTAEQTLARHITIADAQAAATLERHEEARRVIAYIEAQHQAAASQITALEESLARAREERGLLTEDVEHQLARLGRYAEEHHALADETSHLRAQVHRLQQQQDQLVAVCIDLLRESPATWGRAHIALRDQIASLRLPQHNLYQPLRNEVR